MGSFFDKFNMYSGGGLDFLRLSAINIMPKTATAEFCFVCPEPLFEQTQKQTDLIRQSTEAAFSTALKVTIKLTKSHFDPQFFIADLRRFFDYYASLRGCIKGRNVTVTDDENGEKTVKILLKPSAFAAFSSRSLMRELNEFVKSNYCETINITVEDSGEAEEFFEDTPQFSFDQAYGRHIEISEADGLIGYTIFDLPAYIGDAKSECEKIVLCGRIETLHRLKRKPKDGQEKPDFFKFVLSDTTGSINCVYFPTEKTLSKFSLLSEGDEIVVDGKIELNTFNDTSTLTLYPRRISRCFLPKDFKINRLKMNVPERYKNVFPAVYKEFNQGDFFEDLGGKGITENTPQSTQKDLQTNIKSDDNLQADSTQINQQTPLNPDVFVVFDLETTGLDRLNDRIIEIGAVRIENGKLTQTFSTFVDPSVSVPERITKLTGITDADLKNAFTLEEVLPDLLKFFDGATLVGHNIDMFDYPFLSHAAAKHNIYFDNPRLDTFVLAKTYIKMPQYRLKDVAARYNLVNPHAHRALDDAVTTAKAFLAMKAEFNI